MRKAWYAMDKIKIKDLEIYSHHGVLKEENILGQKFLVSVTLFVDAHQAAKQDDLKQSINYAEVAYFIKDFMEQHTFQLIETVAEQLAYGILKQFPLTEQVKLEVKKPWAPILLPLDTVSIEIERRWHTVYLGIGANLGNKEDNLKQAIAMLQQEETCKVTKVSDFIITAPVGGVEQDDFLNGALEVKTLKTPEELLTLIGSIEASLKRVRTVHWGPRTIDLDILLYDDLVINTEKLIIPHKEMHKRAFVLQPLAAIAPQVMHPILRENIAQLSEKVC